MTFPSVVFTGTARHGGRVEPQTARSQKRTDENVRRPQQRLTGRPPARAGHRRAGRRGWCSGATASSERLGAGGFGVVWRAHDLKLERDVAVKVVPRERRAPERSRASARRLAAARLNHPGIVALYEMGTDEHEVYLVSELVQGATLAELSRGRAVRPRRGPHRRRALRGARARARAGGDPPRREARQRDGGGRARRRRRLREAHRLRHRARGQRRGAHRAPATWWAPSRTWRPSRPRASASPPASDVYSLALTLYEAWTGTNPVRGARPAATARRRGQSAARHALAAPDLPRRAVRRGGRRARPRSRLPPAARRAARGAAARGTRALRRGRPGGARDARALRPDRRPGAHDAAHASSPRRRGRRGRGRAAPGAGPRLAAGAAGPAAGLLLLVALETLAPTPPFSPLAPPRPPRCWWPSCRAWAGCRRPGLCGWLAPPDADRAGTALVLAAALAPVPLLLPRAGTAVVACPRWRPCSARWSLAPALRGVAALPAGPGGARVSGWRGSSGLPWPRS